ncbi:hypothetical protein [Roseomonas chloroacetimidivorans]|uniref:hypothetical protein n=1 Tax=Roseomonas chloroacetimidivorans TaxID=1766656 RepID=UPI003C767E13
MARSVEEIEADLAAVRKRMVGGVSLVSVGDMTTRFDGSNDAKTLENLQAELDAVRRGAPVTTRMSFTRINMRRF